MIRSEVNQRHVLLLRGTKGEDDLVDYLLDNPEDSSYVLARRIQSNHLKRAYVEGCLTASNDYPEISAILRIPEEVIERYAKIYYDVEHVDALTLLSVIEEEEDEYAQTLKRWALSQGLEFITWRLGQATDIQPVDGLKSLFNDCYYKSKEAFFFPNSSEASKQSAKWVKLSSDIARLLKAWLASDDEDTRREILVQIKTIEPDFESGEDLNLPENE